MLKRIGSVGLSMMIFALVAAGQTTVMTSGGTTNAVPLFTGSSTVGNSNITQSGGNVGVGTSSPSAGFDVQKLTRITSDTYGSYNEGLRINDAGNSYAIVALGGSGTSGTSSAQWTLIKANDDSFYVDHNGNLPFDIQSNGNVGIGTTSPGAPLEVHGNVKVSGSGANLTFPDSTVQSTAWTGTLTGGDYAESMDVTGSREQYEPGDVLVLDPNHPEQVEKAALPYSTLVAGVYSTRPGAVGRRQKTDKAQMGLTEVPMAMIGAVPMKVSAENGPIHTGDLLVTSSEAGYAMKGTDHTQMMGAVIGKAMGSLNAGAGVIEVLITLQ